MVRLHGGGGMLGRPDDDIPFDEWRRTINGAGWLVDRRLYVLRRAFEKQLRRDAAYLRALVRKAIP